MLPSPFNPFALAVAVVAASLFAIQPAHAASWITANPMITARQSHTATLLPNGKVLVAGGLSYEPNLEYFSVSAAELYDPATGTWAATGAMTTGRYRHTATLLPDGTVLVTGGFLEKSGTLASVELYDPATETWSAAESLPIAREHHTATLLPNGKVLVAGGDSGAITGGSLTDAILYDPATRTWTATGAPTSTHGRHTATLLRNGKVLVAAGYGLGGMTNTTELYDPATEVWTPTGALNTSRAYHTATLLPNGQVLLYGGYNGSHLAHAELYDPDTESWTATGATTPGRYQHTMTVLPNGKVLIMGGVGITMTPPEMYDPDSRTWMAPTGANALRESHTATLLPNGSVLFAGGWAGGSITSSAELYDSTLGTWTNTGALNTAREYFTSTLLPNGKVLAAGGEGRFSPYTLSASELYDPLARAWTRTGPLNIARQAHSATLLPNGQVLVAGGIGYTSGYLSSAELYDPVSATWTVTGALNTNRNGHTATLLPDGRVLVAGGFGIAGSFATTELYDPTTGVWSKTGSLITAPVDTVTLLPNGKVLVTGGVPGSDLSMAELYDPGTGIWTPTSAPIIPRRLHTATLLPSGKVLVAGGIGAGYLASAELYDPVTGSWSMAGTMRSTRAAHTAVLLTNGKVLIPAGRESELYDPETGMWGSAGMWGVGRISHITTLLPDGKVLVAGGWTNGIILSLAELYDVGLGFNSSWQPQVASLTSPLYIGSNLVITGSQFRGVSGASGGNTQDSPTDYPLVRLRSVESGQTLFLPPTHWTANLFVSHPVTNFPPGWALVTVFANGIPSTSSFTLVTKGVATVTLSNLFQVYDGTPKPVLMATEPPGLPVNLTYNGSTNPPTNAGSYLVIGIINDANFQGSATNTLVIGKATASLTLGNLLQTYDGTAKHVSVVTAGFRLNSLTYNGSVDAPTNVGSYVVIGSINNQNYQGGATNTLVIIRPLSMTGRLITPRQNHTATLLPNGKVLVAGGLAYQPSLGHFSASTAELYDPATGTWAATGSMTTGRYRHTATLLPDGTVLVVGGFLENSGTISSVELYNPATETWSVVASLSGAREAHTATLLPSGKVLVAGGDSGAITGGDLSSAELYDPATRTWTTTGSLNSTHHNHTATLLRNGKVLVAAGYGEGGFAKMTELYDPVTGLWTPTGALNTSHAYHTATLLPDGQVLIYGGYNGAYLAHAELYDPATEIWTASGVMTPGRYHHTVTVLPNGKVLVMGGVGIAMTPPEMYDPDSRTWMVPTGANALRESHTATLLPNGNVLFAGGWAGGSITPHAELFDSAVGTWTNTGSLNTARWGHTANLLPNGKVLVAGGERGNSALASAELYHPDSDTWTTTGPMAISRRSHTSTLLADGKVLVTGGTTGFFGIWRALAGAELYDPVTEIWTPTASLNTARFSHTATLLPDGKVLVAGGANYTNGPLTIAELYDPVAETWTMTSPMQTGRNGHRAVLLPNGRVLIAAGEGIPSTALSSAELYNPATGKWTTTGSLNAARFNHTITLLPNGWVLVAGGGNIANLLSSAELYNPVTGIWTPTGALNTSPYADPATLLLDGTVLFAGGYGGASFTSTELYDPVAGKWMTTAPLDDNRNSHTATLLPNGKVLVAGGSDGGGGSFASAELYDVGLGFISSWQPQIASLTSPLYLGSNLVITGSQFRGVSGASGGNTQDSPTDYPLVQLRSVESGQTIFLSPTHWTANSFTSTPVTNFPSGYALVTIFVNGIPSRSSIIAVLNPCDVGASISGPNAVSPGVTFGYTVTVTNFGIGAAENVVVSYPVPSGLTWVGASGNGTFTNGVVTWNFGTLAASAGASFSVTLKAPAAGSFTNIVTVTTSTSDTNPANDSSQAITTVTGGTFSSSVSQPTLNPLTGAYEELVTVTNIGNPLVAVRLLVGDLPPLVSLHHAAGTNGGKPYVEYAVVMNPGDVRTFLLQFSNPYRLSFTNTVDVIAVLPQTPMTNTATGVPISRVFMDPSIPDAPRFTFAFTSVAGRSYQVLFSDDGMQTWSVANTITASANWTVWTEMLPAAEARYFKVVILL